MTICNLSLPKGTTCPRDPSKWDLPAPSKKLLQNRLRVAKSVPADLPLLPAQEKQSGELDYLESRSPLQRSNVFVDAMAMVFFRSDTIPMFLGHTVTRYHRH